LALQAALDSFIKRPCRLSDQQIEALLDELTGALGMCLTAEDYATVRESAPTDPEAFAEMVANLDGLGTGDAALFVPVLRRVLATFEGAARSSA
jgi:hypothetical protein